MCAPVVCTLDVRQAKEVLGTMHTAGLEPGIVAIGAVLNAAKNAASTTPQGVAIVQDAWDLFNTVEQEERNAFVYSSMIGALGQANLRDEAVELFEVAARNLKPWCGPPRVFASMTFQFLLSRVPYFLFQAIGIRV